MIRNSRFKQKWMHHYSTCLFLGSNHFCFLHSCKHPQIHPHSCTVDQTYITQKWSSLLKKKKKSNFYPSPILLFWEYSQSHAVQKILSRVLKTMHGPVSLCLPGNIDHYVDLHFSLKNAKTDHDTDLHFLLKNAKTDHTLICILHLKTLRLTITVICIFHIKNLTYTITLICIFYLKTLRLTITLICIFYLKTLRPDDTLICIFHQKS